MDTIVSLDAEFSTAVVGKNSGLLAPLLFVFLLFGLLGTVVSAQPYGFDQRVAVGPFLNNTLPRKEQSATWSAVVAFPNLTFNNPTYLVAEPRSSRLYVLEQNGRIYSFTNNASTATKTLFLDLTAVTQSHSDCGLLGLVFHPDFGLAGSTNRGYVYVCYTYSPAPSGSPTASTREYNRLSRFTVPDGSAVADPTSELVLMNQYDENYWHNGGSMFFGPDGFLYFSNGDEGDSNDSFNNTQTITNGLFSGIFRIDVNQDATKSHPIRRQPKNGNTLGALPSGWTNSFTANYYIPNDNPWLDTNGGLLEEFYSLGVRSPHRMSYDPGTSRIWLGDVGQNAVEEVDLIVKGGNYQWAYQEGNIAGPKTKPATIIGTEKPPLYAYPHDASGNDCVIGGYVYHGVEHTAYLSGQYIFGDYVSGRVWAMTYDGVSAPTITELCSMPASSLSSFGVDQSDDLYMCSQSDGKIYKLSRTADQSPAPPALLSQTGVFTNMVALTPNPALIPYDVNAPLWSDAAAKSRWMAVPYYGSSSPTNGKITFATNGAWLFPTGSVLIKHFELPIDDTNPSLHKRQETRLLARGTNGSWYGLTYKWRADNSDADLLPGSLMETNVITTATGTRTQVWYYPARSDCMNCHNPNAGTVLGPRTCQLNGDLTYPATGVTDNQLRTLSHVGLFTTNLNEGGIASLPQSMNLTNTAASFETRVRSYLDSNCAHCHRPGGVNANFDARLETPLAAQNLVNATPNDPLGVSGAKIVAPQDLAHSVLYLRDSVVGAGQMPPLAKNMVDTNYIAVLAAWINSIPIPGPIPSPWLHQDVGSVGVAGDATYLDGTFNLTGSGVDIYGTADSFHFVYRPLLGDAVMTAKVEGLTGADGWALAGVMIRQDLTGGSKAAFSGLTTSNGISGVARLTAGASSTYKAGSAYGAPNWVRLTRAGNTLTAYESTNGVAWRPYFTNTVSMTGTVYAGLAYTSHSNNILGSASFSNVLLTGTNVNNNPVAAPDLVTRPISQGVATPVTSLLSNDSDPEGDPLTLLSVTNAAPAGASLNLSNSLVTYWPMFGDTNPGSFNYILSDGRGGMATGLVTVGVQPDPVGTDVLGITAEPGAGVSLNLTGIANFTYTVQFTDTLTPPNWQNLTNATADGTGLISVGDTMPLDSTNRFYRAVRGIAP
jgi:uncharacterized repeat protein (TIGR03806 family)